MKIYDLTLKQQEIVHQLFWLDENAEEDAELIAGLKKEMLKVRESAEGTLEFLSTILLESRAILEAREEAKRRAEARRKVADKAVERLQNVITHIMRKFEIDKVSLKECDISLGVSPGRLVVPKDWQPEKLPSTCYEVIYKPIAKEVKEYIGDGECVDGLFYEKSDVLRVR